MTGKSGSENVCVCVCVCRREVGMERGKDGWWEEEEGFNPAWIMVQTGAGEQEGIH